MDSPRVPERSATAATRSAAGSRAGGWLLPLAIALAAWLGVLATLDTSGVLPTLPGPGLTADEPFDVAYGKGYAVELRRLGWAFFRPDRVREIFGRSKDHPPFGRWLLGWTGQLTDPHRDDPATLVIAPYRVAPATAFALLVFLAGWVGGRWYGRTAGAVASASLVLMPRMFAHAHIAALDTFVSLTYTTSVLVVCWGFSVRPDGSGGHQPRWARSVPRAVLAGAVWGLALLTKIQGALLVVPVAIWAIAFCRRRAFVLLPVWLLAGVAVLYAGWPWLWLAPLENLREFLGRSVDRAAIQVWYFGRSVADRQVPWHYPWVLFATTVPVGLHGLGLAGLACWRDRLRDRPREVLIGLSILFPLVLFSVPGVVVYDGARLFLMVFPLWAIAVGRGGQALAEWLRRRMSRPTATAALTGLLLCQATGLVTMHPYQLSYYNLLVGGLWGADRLGLEVTYWGDSVDRGLLGRLADESPEGSCAVFAPTLYKFHAGFVESEATQTLRGRVRLRGEPSEECRYLVVYNRKGYLQPPRVPDRVLRGMRTGHLVYENGRQGVWLARIYRLAG